MCRPIFILVLSLANFSTLFAATIQRRDGQFESGPLEKIDNTGLRLAGKFSPWNNIRNAYLGEFFSIPAGLQNVTAKTYRGSYPEFPDVRVVKPSSADEVLGNYVTTRRLGNVSGAILFEGKLNVPRSGTYQFHMASDDGARLFVGDKKIADAPAEYSLRRTVARVMLTAGSHDFRLEYLNLASYAILELQWSGPGFNLTPLSSGIEQPQSPTSAAISAGGALAWNGSYIAQPVDSLTGSRVVFSGNPQHIWLSTVNLSAIFFKPISLPHADRIRVGKTGRSGVLLNGGDFQEGEIISIKDNTITVKTLLFGEKKYQAASEALGVFIHKSGRPKKEWTVRTFSGNEIKLKELIWDKGTLVVDRSPFRNLRLKSAEISEISFGAMPHVLHRAWAKWDAMAMSERGIILAHQGSFDSFHQSRANIRAQRDARYDRLQAANVKLKEANEKETAALAGVAKYEKDVYATRVKWELAQARRAIQTVIRDDAQHVFNTSKAVLVSKKANHFLAEKALENFKKKEKVQVELATKTHNALLASNAKQLVADEAFFLKAKEAFNKVQIAYIAELEKAVKAAAMELTAAKLTAVKIRADKSVADKVLLTIKSKLAVTKKAYTDAETTSKAAATKAAAAKVAATKLNAALNAATKDVTGKSAAAAAAKKFQEGLVNVKQKPAMRAAVNAATAAAKAITKKKDAEMTLATAKAALAKVTADFQVVEKASKFADATAATAKKTAVNAAATLIKATSKKAEINKTNILAKVALTKATTDFQSADKVAQAAEAESKVIGADPKKAKEEKDKALAEAVAKRKLADTAKKVLEMANSALLTVDKSKKVADLAVQAALAADVKAKVELAAADKVMAKKMALLNAAKLGLAALTKAMMSTAATTAVIAKASADAITKKTKADKTLAAANTVVVNAKAAQGAAIKAHMAAELVLKAVAIADTKAKAEQVAAGKEASDAKAVAVSAKIMNDKSVALVQAGEQKVETAKKAMADSKVKQDLAEKKSGELLEKKKDVDLKRASSVEITAAVRGTQKSYELAESAWNLAVQQFKESENVRNNFRNTVTAADNTFNNARSDLDAKLLALKKASATRDNMMKQQQSANIRLKQARKILAEQESLNQKATTVYRQLTSPISIARAFVQVAVRHVRDLENDQRRIQDLSKKATLAAGITNRDWMQKSQLFNASKTFLDNAVIKREQPALKSLQAATNSLARVAARSKDKSADVNLASQLKEARIDETTKDKALQAIRAEIGKLTAIYQKTKLAATLAHMKDANAGAKVKLHEGDLLMIQKMLTETRKELAEAKSRVTEFSALQAQKRKELSAATQSLYLARKKLTQATANFTKVNAAYDAAVNAVNLATQNLDKAQVVYIGAQSVLNQKKTMLVVEGKELLRMQQIRVEAEKNKSSWSVIVQKAKAAQKALGKPLDNAQQNLANIRVNALQAEAIVMDRKWQVDHDKHISERALETQRTLFAGQVSVSILLLDQIVREEKAAEQLFKGLEVSNPHAQAAVKTAEEAEVAARMEYEMLIKQLTSAAQKAQAAKSTRATIQREQAEAKHAMVRFQIANRLALDNP